jgi:hypothetical protein
MKFKKINTAVVLAGSLFTLASCGGGEGSNGATLEVYENATLCEDPRPEMCTMDFQPVCGIDQNGAKSTFSNGCGACSNADVVQYLPGDCERL